MKPSTIAKESISTITRNSIMVRRVSKEIRVYTEDDIIRICDDKIRDIYTGLKSAVLGLGPDVTIHPTKEYVAFHRRQAFTGFHPSKSRFRLDFGVRTSELKDPKKIARSVRFAIIVRVAMIDG